MKKLLSILLVLSLLGSCAALAREESVADTGAYDTMLIGDEAETDVAMPQESATRIVEGTVISVTEDQIELEDLVLNIDENTLVADCDLIPTQLKEGDTVRAVASTAATFSLPPQSYAYYVIVLGEETAAPIYMTVAEVKDGFIYSQDGNYEVSYSEAEVGMYRTKNIVKAEELTEGSEIFVYADVMTMSIPALVNPTKIVIMSIAQAQESVEADTEAKTVVSKAEELHNLDILLGTDKGLELDRDVTRAEVIALIQRTSMVPRMIYVSDFDDVAETHWAYGYISWATETGIVQGVGDNKFEPDRGVTAQELAMMLLNAQHIEADYADAVAVASEYGYILTEDDINMEGTLTRDSVAKIIYNYLNRAEA